MNMILALMAAVTLATQWKDIPDTNTVGSVLDLGNGPTAVTNAANGAIAKYDETNLTARISAKYAKPSGGIPMSDLASTLQATIYGKQDALVSGTNIKTINNQSILGPGNIVIEGGGSGGTSNYNLLNNKPIIGGKTVEGSHNVSYYGGVTAQSATNITDAIIASSNLCTVAALQAETQRATAAEATKANIIDSEGTIMRMDANGGEVNTSFSKAAKFISGIYATSDIKIDEEGINIDKNPSQYPNLWQLYKVGGDGSRAQTLPEYLASTSVTNGGAKAYADYVGATTLASATNSAKAYADATFLKTSGGTMNGSLIFDYSVIDGFIKIPVGSFNEFCTIESEAGGVVFSMPSSVPSGYYMFVHGIKNSFLYPDNSDIATSNMVERVIASKPAPSPLTGKTYDFANGVNFTKTLYTALTNVIQTLGGTVTNPPNFD